MHVYLLAFDPISLVCPAGKQTVVCFHVCHSIYQSTFIFQGIHAGCGVCYSDAHSPPWAAATRHTRNSNVDRDMLQWMWEELKLLLERIEGNQGKTWNIVPFVQVTEAFYNFTIYIWHVDFGSLCTCTFQKSSAVYPSSFKFIKIIIETNRHNLTFSLMSILKQPLVIFWYQHAVLCACVCT
jgi:hypothetical protein